MSQSGMKAHYYISSCKYAVSGNSLGTNVFKRLVAQAAGIFVMNVAWKKHGEKERFQLRSRGT